MVKIVNLGIAAGMIAPYYNLLFVIIAVILFIKLFREHTERTFRLPWELLFAIICIFIFEEVLTVLRMTGIISIPIHINGFFELAIAILGVYLIFVQKAHIKKRYSTQQPAPQHKAKKDKKE